MPAAQDNKKYIKVCVEEYIPTLGNVWLTKNYKFSKGKLVEKASKTGLYNVAPEGYEENKVKKYRAATVLEVYADKSCDVETSLGLIGENEKIAIKKVIFPDNDEYILVRAYVKSASGINGWIFVDPTSDEMGNPVNPIVK